MDDKGDDVEPTNMVYGMDDRKLVGILLKLYGQKVRVSDHALSEQDVEGVKYVRNDSNDGWIVGLRDANE